MNVICILCLGPIPHWFEIEQDASIPVLKTCPECQAPCIIASIPKGMETNPAFAAFEAFANAVRNIGIPGNWHLVVESGIGSEGAQ